MDIIKALESPEIFGGMIQDQGTFENWKVFLKSIFALPMTADERKSFSKFTGRVTPPAGQVSEAYVIAGRRSGKSLMAGLISCYLALFRDWRPYLTPGEIATVQIIAVDRSQAAVVLGYIRGILNLKPWTIDGRPVVAKELSDSVELSNGVRITVQTASFRTSRGYTIIATIADEISFWRDQGARPDVEILRAVRPAMASVPGSLLICLSSPYMRSGVLYDAHKRLFGKECDDVLVWQAATRAMNPAIDQGVIDRAMKEDYTAAQAEWEGQFRADLETFLDYETIEAAVVPGRRELPRLPRVEYTAFADPSGGRQDAFTLSICHKEKSGKIVQDVLRCVKPPFDPGQVAAEFSQVLKDYGVRTVRGDRYAGAWVEAAFKENGIVYKAADKTKSDIYLEFLPLLAQGRVELLDNPAMIAEFRGLERRTRSGGKDQVDHGPRGHDDLANAAAGAVVSIVDRSRSVPRVRDITPRGDFERGWQRIY